MVPIEGGSRGDDISNQLFDVGDLLPTGDDDSYTVLKFIARGGTGEVYQLSSDLHGQSRIVKIFIPFYYFERVRKIGLFQSQDPDMSNQVFQAFESLHIGRQEYRTLAGLSHPFVVRVHDLVQIQLPQKSLDRLKSSYAVQDSRRSVYGIIAAHCSGDSFLQYAQHADPTMLMETLSRIAQALDYLNLEKGMLHCDLKSDNIIINRADGLPTVVDFGLAQDDTGDANRQISIATTLLPQIPDNAAAAAVREAIMRRELVSKKDFMASYFPWLDRYQFGILVRRTLELPEERLPRAESEFLRSLSDSLQDVEWLQAHKDDELWPLVARTDANRIYPAVRTGARSEDLRIPSPIRRINVPARFARLAQHPALVRLNRQNQLSLLPARFPGATHTRFLHSLDTFRIARSLARRLLDRAEFRSFMGEEDVDALLVAALYHDVNHLPLLHIFQELTDKDWLPDPMSLALAYSSPESPPLSELLDELGLSLERLEALTRGGASNESVPDRFISSAIDSGMDVDKMSYLQMDSLFSGLHFADGVNIDALIEAADVGRTEGGHLVLSYNDPDGRIIESLVRARVQGFETLYWAKENRAMMALFLRSIRSAALRPEERTKLADLINESIGVSDHTFLGAIDRTIDRGEGVGAWKLASFFDGSWTSIVAALETNDDNVVGALRSMTRENREKFDGRVTAAIREGVSPARAEQVLCLVDLPGRRLNFGGPLYRRRPDGGAVDLANDQRFSELRARLDGLYGRITIFVDRATNEELTLQHTDASKFIEKMLADVLRNDNWA